MESNKHIFNHLRKYRKLGGYPSKAVAKQMGFKTVTLISRWENGHSLPNTEHLLQLSRIYKMLPAQLYSDLDERICQDLGAPKRKIENICGLSFTTRSIGLAVMRDRQLYYWRLSSFQESWSVQKMTRILSAIEKILLKYQITKLAVKVTDPLRASKQYVLLCDAIIACAKKNRIAVRTIILQKLKDHWSPLEETNLTNLSESILEKYPELYMQRKYGKRIQKAYYNLFEAVGLASMHSVTR